MEYAKGRGSEYWQEKKTAYLLILESFWKDVDKENLKDLNEEHKIKLVVSALSEEVRLYALDFVSQSNLLIIANDETQSLNVRIKAINLLQSVKQIDMSIANLISSTKESRLIKAGAEKLQDEEAMYIAICSSNVPEKVKTSLMMRLTESMDYIEAIARNEELPSKVRILALNSGISFEVQKDIARVTSNSDVILFVLDYNMKDDNFLSEMEQKGGAISDRAKSLKRRNKRRKKS